MKPIVSLFLEGLMLVFIFVYSHGEFAVSTEDADDSSSRSLITLHESVRAGSSSEFLVKISPQLPALLSNLFPPSLNRPRTYTAMTDALQVGSSQHNTFYIIASDNVP